jgi:flagella basal body P-ring formation protein FlgA
MKSAATAISVVLSLVGSVGLAGERPRVVLQRTAEVGTATYSLDAIANIQAADRGLRERLGALVIGKAPHVGQEQELPREQIERRVEHAEPTLRRALQWSGAPSVSIRTKAQKLSANHLTEAAAVAVFAVFGKQFKPLELRRVSALDDIAVPAGKVELRPRLQERSAITKRISVSMEIRVAGNSYRVLPLWFSVKAFQPVLVARSSKRAGDLLRREDFVSQPLDVAALASVPVAAREHLTGDLRLKFPLDAGDPLLRSQVEQRPLVVRHQAVAVKVSEGAIVVEATGVALADAHLGDLVKVENPASKQQFLATVVADGTVAIDAR